MRLHPVWGTRVYSNEAFAYHPRDFGQCRVAGGRDGGRSPVVLCGVKTGEVVALSTTTGSRLWSARTKGAVRGKPWVMGEQVYVGSADGCVYRLDLWTGRPSWPKPFCTDGAVDGDPVVVSSPGGEDDAGGLVLFTVTINKVYAVGAKDGRFLWEYHRERPQFMSSEGVSSPTVVQDRVFVGFSDGTLAALALEGGRVVWSATLGGSSQNAKDVDATPVVDGDLVFAGSFGRGPAALTIGEGRFVWQGTWFGATRPAVLGTWLVFGTANGEIVGVRKEDGGTVFQTRLRGAGAAYPPVVVRGWIVAGSDDGLILLDGANGAPVERLGVPLGMYGVPEVEGNRLFLVGSGGTVNAVDVLPR